MNILTETDPQEILKRTLAALLADPDCYYPATVRSYRDLSLDQTANWQARQNCADLLQEFKHERRSAVRISESPTGEEQYVGSDLSAN